MKKYIMFFAALLSLNLFAQNASSYFPSNSFSTWNYEEIPLDSVNNEIRSLIYFKTNSLTAVKDYYGKTANIIVSKVGLNASLPFSPTIDTTFISFDGSDAYSFTKYLNIDSLINILLSSTGSNNSLSKTLSSQSRGRWFSYYHFAQAQYQNYEILSMDTTFDIDSSSISIRYEVKGTHLPDEIIHTKVGDFNCKKFNIQNIISYLFTPKIALPLITANDTVWIAQNQWIVQEIVPTTKIDLSLLGFSTQYFPGTKQVLIPEIPTSINESSITVNDFKLYQNYPNPFNPSTKIKYSIPLSADVKLSVYNLLGNEVITLVNKKQNAGNYEIEFNPSSIQNGLSSGVYFYRLKVDEFISTKKMILLK